MRSITSVTYFFILLRYYAAGYNRLHQCCYRDRRFWKLVYIDTTALCCCCRLVNGECSTNIRRTFHEYSKLSNIRTPLPKSCSEMSLTKRASFIYISHWKLLCRTKFYVVIEELYIYC